MQHLPSDELALCALGEAGPEDARHLEECAECRAEVAALRRVVTAGRSEAVSGSLTQPPSSVWYAIHDRLGLSDAVHADPFDSEPAVRAEKVTDSSPEQVAPASLDAARERRSRRRLPQILGAAAAAVVLAAAGTWGVSQIMADRSEVIAAVDLDPLPAYSESGRAEVDRTPDGGRELVVTASGSDARGFREVWLIAPDVQRMVSLGTMEGTEGRFTIPANLDLDEYPIVDISDEPFDGNPVHSGDSILRGVLEL